MPRLPFSLSKRKGRKFYYVQKPIEITPYMVYTYNVIGKDFVKKLMKVWMGIGSSKRFSPHHAEERHLLICSGTWE